MSNGHEDRTISHDRVLEKLGDGAMRVVYRAEDLNLGLASGAEVLALAIRAHRQMRRCLR